MDALGIPHQVAPLNHTHTYAEVPGLDDELGELWAGLGEKAGQEAMTEALAHKQDALTFDSTPTANSTNPVTSGGVKVALDAKRQIRQDDPETLDHAIVSATANDGDVYILLSVREGDDVKSVRITHDNILNLLRALEDPAAPISGGDQLITNGEVWDALEGKANKVDVKYSVFEKSDANENIELDNIFSDGHETSHFILINRTGEAIKVSEFFYTEYGALIENGQTLSNDSTAIVKIIHYNDGSTNRFYMVVEEVFEA